MIGPLNNSIQSLNIQQLIVNRRCTVCLLVHNLEEDMLIALPRRVFLEWMGWLCSGSSFFSNMQEQSEGIAEIDDILTGGKRNQKCVMASAIQLDRRPVPFQQI
ncbi:hypothetical protein DAPPUDRAFT_232880 [Daphnia pulex]|uniref:Uncharacterized protein n=1 Tax=Daphnia pulex TaxID=6669 RepID=E9FSL2_DAPPU|nr:hypothetical protein DAPPUDRAFT_232880 [Daphnia pulex]|eukprot:EFX89808.1 hypothetical protein DAPPUDRAFT_232880 [Daphnia pulex]